MKKAAPIVLIVAGLIGILACFLPYFDVMGHMRSLWSFQSEKTPAGQGVFDGPKQVYVVLAMFAGTTLVGFLGLNRLKIMHAALALTFCIFTLLCEAVRKGFSTYHGIQPAMGGKMLLAAAIAGILGALMGAFKATSSE